VARSARVTFVAGVLAVLGALGVFTGCDGKVIRLGAGACLHAQLPANQVLWIGDSWQLVPAGAEAHADVLALARAAGAVGPADDYTIAAAPAAPMVSPTTKVSPAPVPTQYATQEATATKVKVLIMDGGTWDTITDDTPATVNSVDESFRTLLSTVAADGTVTDVIYFLMPNDIPGVTELRPLLEQDCTASTVPCHFLDLQQLWTNPTNYNTSTTPPVPTAEGAMVIASAIWDIMQASCIGQ
jgi:hypothetical protein